MQNKCWSEHTKTKVCQSRRYNTHSKLSPANSIVKYSRTSVATEAMQNCIETHTGKTKKRRHCCHSFCYHTDAVPQKGPAVQKRLSNLQSGVCHLLAPTLAETRLRVASMLRLEVTPAQQRCFNEHSTLMHKANYVPADHVK